MRRRPRPPQTPTDPPLSDGSTPFDRLGNLGMSSAGENVAGGQLSASDAMTSFMNSPGHRANILNPAYDCFGGAKVGTKWAQGECDSIAWLSGAAFPDLGSARDRRIRRVLRLPGP